MQCSPLGKVTHISQGRSKPLKHWHRRPITGTLLAEQPSQASKQLPYWSQMGMGRAVQAGAKGAAQPKRRRAAAGRRQSGMAGPLSQSVPCTARRRALPACCMQVAVWSGRVGSGACIGPDGSSRLTGVVVSQQPHVQSVTGAHPQRAALPASALNGLRRPPPHDTHDTPATKALRSGPGVMA